MHIFVSQLTEVKQMRPLHAVSNAIHLAELLADEAEELGSNRLSRRLRRRSQRLTAALDQALGSREAVEPARRRRQKAHAALATIFADTTLKLQERGPGIDVALVSNGPHLDVAERVRFRLRRLRDEPPNRSLDDVARVLADGLCEYEGSVDAYLVAAAEAAAAEEAAVLQSQAVRQYLERAKAHLLTRAEPGSDAFTRIRRRPVRTKRPLWLDVGGASALAWFADEDTATGTQPRSLQG